MHSSSNQVFKLIFPTMSHLWWLYYDVVSAVFTAESVLLTGIEMLFILNLKFLSAGFRRYKHRREHHKFRRHGFDGKEVHHTPEVHARVQASQRSRPQLYQGDTQILSYFIPLLYSEDSIKATSLVQSLVSHLHKNPSHELHVVRCCEFWFHQDRIRVLFIYRLTYQVLTVYYKSYIEWNKQLFLL